MTKHTRTVIETYFLCDECGQECGDGMRTVARADTTELHSCGYLCAQAQDEKLSAAYLAARSAARERGSPDE